MIRLLRAELLRAASRRVIRLLVVGIVAGVVIGVGIATWHSSRGSAEANYERDRAACLSGAYVQEGSLPPSFDSLEEYCSKVILRQNYSSDELQWANLEDIVQGMSSIVILLGAFVGATLGGADWTAGTMGTLLAWEPRRIRVLLVRVFVAATAAFLLAVFAQAFFAAVFRLGVAIAGTTEGAPGGILGTATGLVLRIAAVAAATAIVAHAIATFGRSTVAAVGILFGYLVLVEGFLSHLWTDLQPWLLVQAAVVVVSQQPLLAPTASATFTPNGQMVDVTPGGVLLSVGGAWVVIAGWAVVSLFLALLFFRARDVT